MNRTTFRYLLFSLWVFFLFLCAGLWVHISPEKTYGFGKGIIHGFFAVHNWIISWFDGRLYQALLKTGRGYQWGFLLGLFTLPMLLTQPIKIINLLLEEFFFRTRR